MEYLDWNFFQNLYHETPWEFEVGQLAKLFVMTAHAMSGYFWALGRYSF
jgi:hypothetical protein